MEQHLGLTGARRPHDQMMAFCPKFNNGPLLAGELAVVKDVRHVTFG